MTTPHDLGTALLDFEPEVSGFSGQPMQLFGMDDRGAWKATPNLFVRRVDGSATVMEVKNPGRLNDAKVRTTAERVSAWSYVSTSAPPWSGGLGHSLSSMPRG
ncbi:hypothetical protein [Nonomuraea sp. NPDC003201]